MSHFALIRRRRQRRCWCSTIVCHVSVVCCFPPFAAVPFLLLVSVGIPPRVASNSQQRLFTFPSCQPAGWSVGWLTESTFLHRKTFFLYSSSFYFPTGRQSTSIQKKNYKIVFLLNVVIAQVVLPSFALFQEVFCFLFSGNSLTETSIVVYVVPLTKISLSPFFLFLWRQVKPKLEQFCKCSLPLMPMYAILKCSSCHQKIQQLCSKSKLYELSLSIYFKDLPKLLNELDVR